MKLRWKRLLVLILSMVMIVSAFGTVAMADENVESTDPLYEYTDPYVLTYRGDGVPAKYKGYQSFWFSPHRSYYINRETGEEYISWSNILAMYNRNDDELIPAYCLDMLTGGVAGYNYRRLNLEDASYFTARDAGRLRATMLRSFPVIEDVTVIQKMANEWLAENGMGQIVGLTGSEALTATQFIVWALSSNGDGFLEEDAIPYYYTTVPKAGWSSLVMFPMENTKDPDLAADPRNQLVNMYGDATVDENGNNITASNITLLAEYYLNLEPAAPADVVISNASIKDASIAWSVVEPGNYTATVTLNVDATINEDDQLKLTVRYGEKSNTIVLTSSGVQTITLSGLPAEAVNDNLTLEINGHQTAEDVYLFDATENRGSSQSLIAFDKSRLPVHAEVQVGAKMRVLNIFKYGPKADSDQAGTGIQVDIADNKAPLENVEFAIYWVGTAEEVFKAGLDDAVAYYNKLDALTLLDRWIATVKTDAAGHALYNFSANGQPDGVYMVVEKPSSAVDEVADPFFVSIPMTKPDGDGWMYDIYVYPKNDIQDSVEIDKDVTELGNKVDTADVNEDVKWIISGNVPVGMYDNTESGKVYAKKYEISDMLDHRLTYQEDSLQVKLFNKAGEEIVLTADQDYTLVVSDETDADGNATKKLLVSLTEEGIKNVVKNLKNGEEVPQILVEFVAVINTSADLGVEIYNDATVIYTNYAGWTYSDEVDDLPHVHTGGFNILKFDAKESSKHLAGAVFMVARPAEETDAPEDIKTLVVNGGTAEVVYVDFFNTEDMSGNKVSSVTTDDNGEAVVYGLAYGTYYIVETKAPAGYNLLSYPITITVDANSHTEAAVVRVANSNTFRLPETGGIGTAIFTLAGSLMMGGAGVMLVNKKREEE